MKLNIFLSFSEILLDNSNKLIKIIKIENIKKFTIKYLLVR